MPAAASFAAVNNFVFLARYQYYNGTFFHRVIPGFVVQGGDPTGTGTGGPHGYPGYSFTGNTPPASCKTKQSQAACYQPGDIALANSTGPSTDASQFFFVLPGGQTTLNTEPNYTIFGHVVSGMNVVDKIGADGSSSGTPTVTVYLLSVTVSRAPTTTTTAAPTATTVAPTTTTQPAAQVLLNQQGSGQSSLPQFTVGSGAREWALGWAYNCSAFGSSGNFIVNVNGFGSAADTTDAGVNELGMSGNSVEYYYDTGTFQLVVNSECNWSLKVTASN
jgi:cyclophilin family peptidyl-prolyl cis-trans isomerase